MVVGFQPRGRNGLSRPAHTSSHQKKEYIFTKIKLFHLQGSTPVGQAGSHPGMDTTEELIPTLPELGNEINSDIMQTILNSNKAEPGALTWL